MGLIDSHAHLTFPELRDHVDEALARCGDAGVDRIITIGVNLEDGRKAIELAANYEGRVHAAAAFHPHEAGSVSEADLAAMAKLWDHPSMVAIGEMGLDYHYDFADRAAQRRVFARQLELAATRIKPLVIHCREAFDDVIRALIDHGFEGRPVVFHCFTGTPAEALRVQEHRWRISFTGIVTFTSSTTLQAIAKVYPKSTLMIETDSPYLSPVPLRGKQPNEPANIVHLARFLAGLRGVSLEEIVEQTSVNTLQFFGL
jgi:TatD DNase family protein